jgi:predicted lipoprotein with Yx(FWY)xxD motif
MTMRTIALLAALASVLVLTGKAGAADRSTLTVHGSNYGQVLVDGRGFALYVFTRDRHGKSACSGACAAAWPPYLVKQAAKAGAGTRSTLLGTTKRSDGTLQVTYAGRPLYYYVGDRSPGQILCQNVSEYGGLWLVVRASGIPVR